MPLSLADIELRSEEVQEVLSPPSFWLLSSGSTILLGVVILMLGLAAFLKYPDVIPASISLTTPNPTIKIVVPTSGKLIRLLHHEDATVQDSTVLAEIESQLNPKAMQYLNHLLPQMEGFIRHPIRLPVFEDKAYVFGELQNVYNELKKECFDYYQWTRDRYRQEEVLYLKEKISSYQKVQAISKEQLSIDQKVVQNAEEKFNTQKQLYQEKIISRASYLQEESSFYQQEQSLISLKKSIAQEDMTIRDINKQLIDIQFEQSEKCRNFKENLKLKTDYIYNEINRWQKNFLIRTPIAGTLSYSRMIAEGQYVQAGEPLFAVVPKGNGYIGIMEVPTQRFGKVKVGQPVYIKLDNYPYQEFGYLIGKVHKIRQLLNKEEGLYRVEVILNDGLNSTYDQQIPYRPEMTGTGEIITESLSVLERIFFQFRSILRPQT